MVGRIWRRREGSGWLGGSWWSVHLYTPSPASRLYVLLRQAPKLLAWLPSVPYCPLTPSVVLHPGR